MTGGRLTDPRIAFLVFRSRSGSTFLGDRLSRHPEILVTPESNIAPRLIKYFDDRSLSEVSSHQIIEYIYSEKKFSDWKLPQEILKAALQKVEHLSWSTTFETCCYAYRDWKKPGANVVIFKKSGWYYRNAEILLNEFPKSKIIWMLRDPRAIYNSASKAIHSETKKPMADSILKNSLGWRDYANRLRKIEKRWPEYVLIVRYESFLADFKNTLISTWQGLGVNLLDDININEILNRPNESHLITSATKHLHGNVAQKPIIDNAVKWKKELPAWKAAFIKFICWKTMEKTGYY